MRHIIKLAGVTYDGRQNVISRLSLSDTLSLERDYHNKYDGNAIAVLNEVGQSVGWVPRDIARNLAPIMDRGEIFSAYVHNILGGGSFYFGLEIAVVRTEISYINDNVDPEKKRMLDAVAQGINNYSEEESQAAFDSFNTIVAESTEEYILEGNFERLLPMINNHWLALDSIRSFAEHLFSSGQFEKAFRCLLTLEYMADLYEEDELANYCRDNLQIFNSLGFYVAIPETQHGSHPQSMESANESYPELTRVQEAIKSGNMESLIEELFSETKSFNNEIKAQAHFCLGELFFLQEQYNETLIHYRKAIELNSNKALYWGYTAQVMNRDKRHPISCSRYIMKAIELDGENPRWHFLQAVFLLNLIKEEEIDSVIEQASNEAHLALRLCREDQEGLRKAILTLFK
ncbi:HIRAN domain-containing protein [Bacillus sp. EB01]|uniref:HIRAN domain-containing protein n=1 Tax=Bacillus sp. EB01 TaxID=1347086 RepID=UPI0005C794EC|nr:HIRAN domain-containing protein [Bacillus sp. EB01]